MENMVLMTKQEFKALQNRIHVAEHEADEIVWRLTASVELCKEQRKRADNLWQMLNRPAIEEAAKKHNDEFYEWCTRKADEYEQKDFEDWCVQKAKSYNNGRKNWCKFHKIPEEEYEELVKYNDLLCERSWVDKTEGWTELHGTNINDITKCDIHRKDNSWILAAAQADAWDRYVENENKTGVARGKFWKLVISFEDMIREGKQIDSDFGGFYR